MQRGAGRRGGRASRAGQASRARPMHVKGSQRWQAALLLLSLPCTLQRCAAQHGGREGVLARGGKQ